MSLDDDIRDMISEELTLYRECDFCNGTRICYCQGCEDRVCCKCDGEGRVLNRFGVELTEFLDGYFIGRERSS